MTEINKRFIEAMQERLNEKSAEYDGKSNPRNYKNMELIPLTSCLYSKMMDYQRLVMQFREIDSAELMQKKLCDIANFCWMLWESLERK